ATFSAKRSERNRVEEINSEQNPIFGGVNPEPIAKNLSKLRSRVLAGGFDLGIAVDGDGDRAGAIDERGNFVNSHQILALLLRQLAKKKGLEGSVVRTISTTSLIDLMAEAYGKKVLVTPVGFKYVAQHILKGWSGDKTVAHSDLDPVACRHQSYNFGKKIRKKSGIVSQRYPGGRISGSRVVTN
ncbi:hypothetical protein HKBW3S43_02043, partial [Candidatus Hakubella thermalkaliphila]